MSDKNYYATYYAKNKDYFIKYYTSKKEHYRILHKKYYKQHVKDIAEWGKQYRKKNSRLIKEKSKIRGAIYRKKNKAKVQESIKRHYKKYPWRRTLRSILSRVGVKNAYKKVKCLITGEQLKKLWFRDKAYLMKQPSIDRIDTCGDYTFENCRYVELLFNLGRKRRFMPRKNRRRICMKANLAEN